MTTTNLSPGELKTRDAVETLDGFVVPTAEDLARPVLAAIRRLHNIAEETAGLEWLVANEGGEGGYSTLAGDLLAAIDGAVRLVDSYARACTFPEHHESVAAAVRALFGIADIYELDGVRQTLFSERAWRVLATS